MGKFDVTDKERAAITKAASELMDDEDPFLQAVGKMMAEQAALAPTKKEDEEMIDRFAEKSYVYNEGVVYTQIRELEYEPGNGTMYHLVFTKLPSGMWLMAWLQQALAFQFNPDSVVAYDYFVEKTGHESPADVVPLLEIIHEVTEVEIYIPDDLKKFGRRR